MCVCVCVCVCVCECVCVTAHCVTVRERVTDTTVTGSDKIKDKIRQNSLFPRVIDKQWHVFFTSSPQGLRERGRGGGGGGGLTD